MIPGNGTRRDAVFSDTPLGDTRSGDLPLGEAIPRNRWRGAAVMFAVVLSVMQPPSAAAQRMATEPRQACPPAIAAATRLVVVTADDPNGPRASLATFQRPSARAPWQPVAAAEPAVVGAKGVAWGVGFATTGEPRKTEGDGRAPAGIYSVGRPFGSAPGSDPAHLRLEAGQAFCVDDPSSPHYNRIVPVTVAGARTSGEKMWSEPLYRRGLLIDYPADRAGRGGSCIFIHVWRQAGKGTAGCVALPEPTVARLQAWVVPGATAIAILAKGWAKRFAGCLPDG